ncbi:MAG TPA: hypothetical protein VFJ19_17925 [Nocardioidaceae bacterium]|nr:hypothetical protein [Nocardioidaceae bacterium]
MRKLLAAAAAAGALVVVGAPTPTLAAPTTASSPGTPSVMVPSAVTHTMHSCGWKHHSM